MDYSLLLTIESFKQKSQHFTDRKRHRNTIVSDNLRYRYHIGIIDYLQEYNSVKKVERFFKQMTAEDKVKSVAAAPP